MSDASVKVEAWGSPVGSGPMARDEDVVVEWVAWLA